MIGENIKRLLNEKEMTQRQLAINSACTESAISKYIGGQREPNYETLKRITKALGVKADELFEEGPGEKTNFDRIKAMTADEAARELSNLYYEVARFSNAKHYIEKWLQEKAK